MLENENLKDQSSKIYMLNQVMLIGVSLFVIFITNLLFNYWICAGNRVFYGDDLVVFSKFLNSDGILKFIFSLSGNRVRPIAYMIIGLVLKFAANNYEIIDETLLVLNFINAALVFYFIYVIQAKQEFIKRNVLSLSGALLFIASRFAYYNISELIGLMEGVGITFSIGMLLLLYLYINRGDNKYIVGATILYVLVMYTHERYFLLFICFMVATLVKKNSSFIKRFAVVLPAFALILFFWIVRVILFGNRAIAGTGGTYISDTFDLITAIKFCFSQVGYIFGFNCGPRYLNGINAGQVPRVINFFLVLNLLCVLCVVILYVRLLIRNELFRCENLKNIILFITFIALCIISSSTTIRVEMRWIYTSYTAYVILLFYMIDGIFKFYSINAKALLVFTIYLISIFITEQFYRGNYSHIYYWDDKDMTRELHDITVDKYGDKLANMKILIVSESQFFSSWDEKEWKRFFRPYVDSSEISVYYVESINDAKQLAAAMSSSIVLYEDSDNRVYTDITNVVKDDADRPSLLTINNLYGIYRDWWCEPDCKFEVLGYNNNKVKLMFYYPGDRELIGTASGKIIVNGEIETDFSLTDNLTSVEIPLSSDYINTVQILSDYWVLEDTGRSEDGRLSCVLTVQLSH